MTTASSSAWSGCPCRFSDPSVMRRPTCIVHSQITTVFLASINHVLWWTIMFHVDHDLDSFVPTGLGYTNHDVWGVWPWMAAHSHTQNWGCTIAHTDVNHKLQATSLITVSVTLMPALSYDTSFILGPRWIAQRHDAPILFFIRQRSVRQWIPLHDADGSRKDRPTCPCPQLLAWYHSDDTCKLVIQTLQYASWPSQRLCCLALTSCAIIMGLVAIHWVGTRHWPRSSLCFGQCIDLRLCPSHPKNECDVHGTFLPRCGQLTLRVTPYFCRLASPPTPRGDSDGCDERLYTVPF